MRKAVTLNGEMRRPPVPLKFAFFGLYFIALGAWTRPAGVLLGWFGLSFLCVAWSYVRADHRAFGKRDDGTMALIPMLLFLPHILCVWAVWRLHRLRGDERPADLVAPGLWLGRRPAPEDMPDEAAVVVDLTNELPAPRSAIGSRVYLALPTLDGMPPGRQELERALDAVARHPGPLYVHCMVGHGRSATFMGALLLRRGLARSAAEAVSMMHRARPGVTLSAGQSDLLETLARPSEGSVSSKIAGMAKPELEFMLEGSMVGLFQEREYPCLDGRYSYMPYRGAGHYRMQETLRASGSARCYYDVGGSRVFFEVSAAPESGILELSRFTRTDRPAS